MIKTNTGLVAHVTAQLGLPYWYGTYGKIATLDILQQKAAQYPKYMTADRVKTAQKRGDIGKRTYDCAGLIKSYMMQDTPTSVPKYQAVYDKNVPGLIALCPTTGKIATLPELPGVLVFRGTEHVGIYIGGGLVIEAKGFVYGVVRSKLADGKWDKWGKLSWIDYAAAPTKIVPPHETIYTVAGGDNLSKIAARYGCKVADIIKINPAITDPNIIRVGQKIKIPGAK
jgi:LysM repeat protein